MYTLLPGTAFAKGTKLKVLFIGNSYTYVNDLPATTESIARSMGDTLIRDMSAPGGQTFKQHSTNTTTLSKISAGDWQYVVLQEQSQSPAFPDAQVARDVLPYARFLDSLVHDKNPCGRSIFYRTWGYPDGDAGNCPGWPPICTYRGMDSMLQLRYSNMAVSNNALLSPVGEVFKELMKTAPGINLFDTDRKHPSPAGTYAAAVTFYTILFRKDPSLISFNAALSAADANTIKNVVKTMVYADLAKFHVGKYDPEAAFTVTTSVKTATFNSAASVDAISFSWNFGDGNVSSLPNPVHTYAANGVYKVKLYVYNTCGMVDSLAKDIGIGTTGIGELNTAGGLKLYPNPAHSELSLEWDGQVTTYSVQVYNTTGTSVLDIDRFTGSSIAIDHLPKGLYFIKCTSTTGAAITSKFVKE